MKGFYVISLLFVAALTLLPLWLLKKEKPDRFAGRTVSYNVYGSKVNSMESSPSTTPFTLARAKVAAEVLRVRGLKR